VNKKEMQNRIKFSPAYKKKILESKPTSISRREQNYIDDSDLKKDSIVSDFFEFEKELSEMKPSNKINSSSDDLK